jgi:Organic solute transporter Ostalpha
MFWLSISEDLNPFRSVPDRVYCDGSHSYAHSPMPKFLCVKGILFFSFWQATGVSLLASVGAIKKLGPYTDKEHISLGLTDSLICLEMPFFAIAHLVAFSHRDYIDKKLAYIGRMPVRYAFRDAFGFKDVIWDARATLNGQGMDYREFEPSEGHMHQGLGRERRIRAGLRYSRGGQRKYWLPQPASPSHLDRSVEGGVSTPLLAEEAEHALEDPSLPAHEGQVAVGFDLPFGDLDSDDEDLFVGSRKYLFGDYNFPCIDASSELARAEMWEEEERILSDERSAWFSDYQGRRAYVVTSYGSVTGSVSKSQQDRSHTPSTSVSVIHPEHDHQPAGEVSDLQLRLTNAFAPRSGSKTVSSPAVPGVSPLSLSTKTSPFNPVLRPDAVDLVLEDPNTVGHAVIRGHQQGESQPPSAKEQAYQRLAGNVGREGVAEESERGKREASTSRALHQSTKTEANTGAGADFGDIARLQPVQVKGSTNRYDLEDDLNPWA